MSEIQDLLALHGAIDRQLQSHPELIDVVAPLLPAYHDPETLGWYDAFERWVGEQAPDAEFPDVETALANMATAESVRPRSAARRLLALGALTRAFPGSTEFPVATLAPTLDFSSDLRDGQALDLLGLLAGPEFDSIEQWPSLLSTSYEVGLVSRDVAAQQVAPPLCEHRVVETPWRGAIVQATQLETSFWTDQVSFECASRVLDPLHWPDCSEFWCDVTQVDTTITAKKALNPVYREVVSLDCAHRNTAWSAMAYLECHRTTTSDRDRLDFDLAPAWTSAGDDIMVDEGSLSVQKVGTGIRVETVKRIKFRHLFSPRFLAVVMCVIGYGDQATDLTFNCAIDCKPKPTKPAEQASKAKKAKQAKKVTMTKAATKAKRA